MAEHSDTATISLASLLHEIGATPRDYWAEVLGPLREFRQKIPVSPQPIINAEQAKKNQAAINLLDSWLGEGEDAAEHQKSWDFLKMAFDEDRLSDLH